MTKEVNKSERKCLEDERHFLHEDMDKCGYCSGSYSEFSSCWHDSAKASGARSRGCLL